MGERVIHSSPWLVEGQRYSILHCLSTCCLHFCFSTLQEGFDSAKKAVGGAAENVKEGAQDLGDRITGKQ